MMTWGGYRSRVEHRLFARRIRLGGLLFALAAAMVLAAGVGGNAYAQLGSQVTVVNDGAIQAGSAETFGATQSGNALALYDLAGPLTLLGQGDTTLGASLISPTGVAISPVDEHIYATDSYVALAALGVNGFVLVFSPSASGNSAPEQIIYDPSFMISPDGVAFDVGNAHPSVDDSVSLAPGNAAPSIDTEGDVYVANTLPLVPPPPAAPTFIGSIEEFKRTDGTPATAGAFPGPSTPVFTIRGPSTVLFGPVGLFVDETTIDACLWTGLPTIGLPGAPLPPLCTTASCVEGAIALCTEGVLEAVSEVPVSLIFPIPTRRIWAVNRFGGFVGIYAPELAEFLGVADCSTVDGVPNVCNEPPVAGFFATTEDGLLPPPAGTSTDPTTPNYIAFNQSESKAYVTDLTLGAGGPKAPRGRIKTFDTFGFPDCLLAVNPETFATCTGPSKAGCFCLAADNPFESASYVSGSEISGKATKLYMPMGIGALTESDGSVFLYVANVMANSVLQFGPNPTGDIRPSVSLSGRRTKLDQPVGLTLPPVPFR